MSFVYPSFLWALFALAIPLIIHFFNFRRVKKVYFTNVRFLKELKTETNSFKVLKELLILLMRLGLVASLVLAFSQPFLPNQNKKSVYDAASILSIYLDNSYSMQNELTKRKYLSWAKESISDLVRIFPKSANFQLVTNDFRSREQFPINSTKVEDILSETNFSNRSRDLQSIHNRQQNLLKKFASNEKNQIFWVSDFQKSTLGNLEKIQLDSNTQYYLVHLQSEQKNNLHIDSAWLANPFVKENEQNSLTFRIQNHSDIPQEDLVAKLFIDDLQVSTTTLDIAAEGKASGTFSFVVQGRGTKKGRIVVEDSPITFDNEYYFTLQIAPTIRIAHWYSGGGNPYIRNVYASEKTFNLVSYDQNTFNTNALPNIDLLIIDNFSTFPANLGEELKKFTENGGCVLVFPSSTPNLNSYTQLLSGLGVRGLQAEPIDSLGKSSTKTLLPPNISNPFYEGIFEQNPKNADMPYGNAVISWLGINSQLLGFKNGKNFLSEFKNGRGKLYLCASPLDRRFSDFPTNALFVPIMYKIAARSLEQNERIAYSFQDRRIMLKIPQSNKNQVFKLRGKNATIVPGQRLNGQQLILELPEQSIEAGYYDIVDYENNTVGALAFNYDKQESEMKFYSTEELKKIFGNKPNVQIYENIADKKLIQDFQERNIGTPLWKYFVWAALLFALFEVLIIRFWTKKTKLLTETA